MMNKKGAEHAIWIVVVLVIFVAILLWYFLGPGIANRKLFGVIEKAGTSLNESTSGLFDFGKLFGFKKEAGDKEKLCQEKPEECMNKIFADGEYERYVGICNGDRKYKGDFDDAAFEKLKNACDQNKKQQALVKIEQGNEEKKEKLRKEFFALFNDCHIKGAEGVLARLSALGENEKAVSDKKEELEKRKTECVSKIEKLSIENEECKNKEDPVEAIMCDGDTYFNKGDHVGAARAYSKLVSYIKNSDNEKIKAWMRLGQMYESYGRDLKKVAYNLYEDLATKYSKSRPDAYGLVLQRLKNIYEKDKEFYLRNVEFSALGYRTELHGGIDIHLDTDDFDWTSLPIKGQSEIVDSRAGFVEIKSEIGSTQFITFSPSEDARVFGINSKVFGKGSNDKPPKSVDQFNCIEEEEYFITRSWGKNKGANAKGVEIGVLIRDAAGNALCEDGIVTDGEEFSRLSGKMFKICDEVFPNANVVWEGSSNNCNRRGDNDIINVRLIIGGAGLVKSDEQYLYNTVFGGF